MAKIHVSTGRYKQKKDALKASYEILHSLWTFSHLINGVVKVFDDDKGILIGFVYAKKHGASVRIFYDRGRYTYPVLKDGSLGTGKLNEIWKK